MGAQFSIAPFMNSTRVFELGFLSHLHNMQYLINQINILSSALGFHPNFSKTDLYSRITKSLKLS